MVLVNVNILSPQIKLLEVQLKNFSVESDSMLPCQLCTLKSWDFQELFVLSDNQAVAIWYDDKEYDGHNYGLFKMIFSLKIIDDRYNQCSLFSLLMS